MKKKTPKQGATDTTDNFKPVYHLKHKSDKEIIAELLATTIKLQKHLDMLILLTPSGDRRNELTNDNILVANLIQEAKE